MKTREDAKRATELCDEKDRLIACANEIRIGDKVYFSTDAAANGFSRFGARLNVKCLQDEFRALVTKELKAQVAKIDKELRALGIEPDPFEAAAPAKPEKEDGEDGGPATIVVKERRR